MEKLPSEILCEIFHESVAKDWPYADRDFGLDSIVIPLRISHVSRRWRSESLSFGALWSYLCLIHGHADNRKMHIFDTWLRRANGSPLNFTLRCHLTKGRGLAPEAHRITEHMLRIMLSQQERWRDVDLCWTGLCPSPDFAGFHAINMPILSSLVLRIDLKTHTGEEMHANVSIARSTRLKKLDISGNFILAVGQEPIHTLKGPCTFHPFDIRLDIYLDFLKIAPNLEWLDIDVRRSDMPLHDGPALVLERLRNLRLLIGESTSFIIEALTLPALNALYFRNYDKSNEGETLLKFFQRSMPPLTHLQIGGSVVNERTFIDALRLLPSLQELYVEKLDAPTWLFEALTLRDVVTAVTGQKDNFICPRLGSFRLDRISIPQNDTAYLDAFCSMLESRWKVLQTFNMVRLDEGYDQVEVPLTSDEDYFKLRSFFDEGGTVWAVGDRPVAPSPFNEL